MQDRNLYARSKAECETQLLALHKSHGLPLVIARPGIVVGQGGPLQHWGIGRWHGAGAVKIWGAGKNVLPFVLIDDVADGLMATMDAENVLGESFNLVGPPLMTARGYFDAIHAATGARIDLKSGALIGYYVNDALKHVLKKHVLRRKNLDRASLRDWKSRAHYSQFDNGFAREKLSWEPESDYENFVKKAITDANLFGF
ncbi:MAG: nucleoside-diphosphate-sugar epimerase [Paracoccaceae bacterium]|jgi:nucleoside-diphosphate-sugar epimerase